jgi:hypothetical protein
MKARLLGFLVICAAVTGCAPKQTGNVPRLGPLTFGPSEEMEWIRCEKAAQGLSWKEFAQAVDESTREVSANDPKERMYQIGMRVAQRHPSINVDQVRRCCEGVHKFSGSCGAYLPLIRSGS